jgi:hypothetical protein
MGEFGSAVGGNLNLTRIKQGVTSRRKLLFKADVVAGAAALGPATRSAQSLELVAQRS